MNFRTKSYLTLTKQSGGILGAEVYILPQGLEAYGRVIHDANYYLAEADKDNWHICAKELAAYVPIGVAAMEYGTGDLETVQKTGAIIKTLNCTQYIGVDLNKASIDLALHAITAIKKDIEAVGLEQDFWAESFPISAKPTLAMFAGGSIENFEVPVLSAPPRNELVSTLTTLANRTNNGWLLVSADMLLSGRAPQHYESAYSGADHATFNLSVFYRMQQELGIGIDPTGFDYKPEFNPSSGAIQHMAYANKAQTIDFDGEEITVKKGDAFHIQNSFRFTEAFFDQCVCDAGLTMEKVWKHPTATMYLYLLRKDQNLAMSKDTTAQQSQRTA